VLECPRCKKSYNPDPYKFACSKCGELLDAKIISERVRPSWNDRFERRVHVWRYRDLLPEIDNENIVTLYEGGTPLIKLSGSNVYVKFEGLNPTGSFKDRGMTVGVSIAKSIRVKTIIVASTGNTAASAAAYSARAGIECLVVLPKGGVARGKLVQAILHGAKIVEIEGNFDKALDLVISTVINSKVKGLVYPLNSFNVWRLEGQKTIAYEVFEEIGIPDWVIVPVGNAGNIYAIWKGFKELHELGLCNKLPKMIGVQAEGASPIASAWIKGLNLPLFTDNPRTVASAIRIGKPVNWYRAWRAVSESRGFFTTVSDDEIIKAQKILGREGIGVEPASASSMAAYLRLINEGVIDRKDLTVLVATGHGLKDPDVILKDFQTINVKNIDELVNTVINLNSTWIV